MANQTIVDLTANTTPASTDIMPMVDDPGGTPATQKITLANLDTFFSGTTQTIAGVKTFGSAGAVGRLKIAGTTSGAVTLNATAVAGTGTLTLPNATDTLVGKATTDTLTNKILQPSAGTASAGTAPLKFTSGTNNSTAEAGAVEYDGNAIYGTTVASTRGVIPTVIFTSIGASNFTGANSATAQPVFNTTEDVLTVPGSTGYIFEAMYNIATTGTTSHALQILFGGTATITSIAYAYTQTNSTVATNTACNSGFVAVATATSVTTAVAAATNNTVTLRGFVRINAGGTFIPQFQFSAAPGVAPTIQIGSFFYMYPIGTNTVKYVGNWA